MPFPWIIERGNDQDVRERITRFFDELDGRITVIENYVGNAPSGGIVLGFKFNASVAEADPGAGYVSVNNIDVSLVTKLFLSKTSEPGNDVSGIISSVVENLTLIGLFEKLAPNGTAYFESSGTAIDQGTYFEIPIGDFEAISVLPTDQALTDVYLIASGDRLLPPGGDTDWILKKASAADYDVVWVDGTTLYTPISHYTDLTNPHEVQHSQVLNQTPNDHHNQSHLLYGPDHSDVDDTAPLVERHVLGWDGFVFRPQFRVNWRGTWGPQEYQKHDQAVDGGYLGITNKITSERLAPQELGVQAWSYPDVPVWTEYQNTSLVGSGHRYIFTEAVEVRGIRVWVPEVTANTTFRLIQVVNPDTTPAYSAAELTLLTAGEWNILTVVSELVLPGTELIYYLESLNSGSSQEWAYNWVFQGNQNAATPPIGEWNKHSQNNILRINWDDAELVPVNHQLELQVVAGTIFQISEIGDPSAFQWFRVEGVYTEGADYTSYPVSVVDQGVSVPSATEPCQIRAVIPISEPTKFVGITGYWTANQPVWGTITSFLAFDGVDQGGATDDGFGIDLFVQRLSVSEDWDIQAASGVTGSGGGGGGGEPFPEPTDDGQTYGRITGNWVPVYNKTEGAAAVHTHLYDDITDAPWEVNGADVWRSGGKIGIGTNVPDDPITVVGDLSGLGIRLSTTVGGSRIQISRATQADANGIYFQTADVNEWFQGSSADGHWRLKQGGFDGTIRLTQLTNGNFGIGLTTPTHRLDVNGDANLIAGFEYKINGIPHVHEWVDIANKPVTYPPDPHTHAAFTGAGTEGFVPDPTVSTNKFLRDDGTWQEVNTAPAGGVSTVYDFNAQTAGIPGPGELSVNNADQTLATSILAHDLNKPGNDLTPWLENMIPGDLMGLNETGGGGASIWYTVTGTPVDLGTGWEIPVALSSGTGGIANAAEIDLVLVANPESKLPPGGTTGQRLAKATDVDYDTEWVSQYPVVQLIVDTYTGPNGTLLDAHLPDIDLASRGWLNIANGGMEIQTNRAVPLHNGSCLSSIYASSGEYNFTLDITFDSIEAIQLDDVGMGVIVRYNEGGSNGIAIVVSSIHIANPVLKVLRIDDGVSTMLDSVELTGLGPLTGVTDTIAVQVTESLIEVDLLGHNLIVATEAYKTNRFIGLYSNLIQQTSDISMTSYCDNTQQVFLSVVAGEQGRLVGEEYDLNVSLQLVDIPLVQGVTNYLQIKCRELDLDSDFQMFVGNVSLNDTKFSFTDTSQYMYTLADANWKISPTGFPGPYSTATDQGQTPQDPWGAQPDVDPLAHLIRGGAGEEYTYFQLVLSTTSSPMLAAFDNLSLFGSEVIPMDEPPDDGISYSRSHNRWDETYTRKETEAGFASFERGLPDGGSVKHVLTKQGSDPYDAVFQKLPPQRLDLRGPEWPQDHLDWSGETSTVEVESVVNAWNMMGISPTVDATNSVRVDAMTVSGPLTFPMGILLNQPTAVGEAVVLLTKGLIKLVGTSNTCLAGDTVYVGTTSAAPMYVPTPPSNPGEIVQILGHAVTDDILYIDPQPNYVVVQ